MAQRFCVSEMSCLVICIKHVSTYSGSTCLLYAFNYYILMTCGVLTSHLHTINCKNNPNVKDRPVSHLHSTLSCPIIPSGSIKSLLIYSFFWLNVYVSDSFLHSSLFINKRHYFNHYFFTSFLPFNHPSILLSIFLDATSWGPNISHQTTACR